MNKNKVKSTDSIDEIDDKSDTETELFDKGDSDSPQSQSDCNSKQLQCAQCKINFQIIEEVEKHKRQKHPMIVYRCTVDNCPRWFSTRKSRDKHSENVRSRLHKDCRIKSPPSHAIFIENASPEQLEIVKNYSNVVSGSKGKRGPKPKYLTNEAEKSFLVGLPKEQLKRKLMESVVEKLESSPNKKQGNDSPTSSSSPSKRRPSSGQLSQSSSVTTPNVSSPKPQTSKQNISAKIVDIDAESPTPIIIHKSKPIPNLSHLKVPVLLLDNDSFSLSKFSKDLITLLTNYDVAEYFKYPLIDHFAPGASQLDEQIDMKTIKERLKLGHYSNNFQKMKSDLLKLYSNGIHSFKEKSLGWHESAKLYQTALVNIENVENKLMGDFACNFDTNIKEDNKSVNNEAEGTHLNILNPYNNGKLNDHERIISLGEQTGKLKSQTQYLNNFKEDRRNKISILSYLDYGPNFSFGPCFDSGNAYCTKEVSDLLIRGYGDHVDEVEEEEQYRDLNEIIPEPGLGDDFSLYLMNVFTRDILKSSRLEEKEKEMREENERNTIGEKEKDIVDDNRKSQIGDEETLSVEEPSQPSRIQEMLDNNSQDLKQLKYFNYRRLANHEMQPSNDEWNFADRVTSNLTSLISEVTPASVSDRSSIRKALDFVL